MMQKYPTLAILMAREPAAKRYYDELPDYVREAIRSRGDGVNSFASLRDYAENLLRGDI